MKPFVLRESVLEAKPCCKALSWLRDLRKDRRSSWSSLLGNFVVHSPPNLQHWEAGIHFCCSRNIYGNQSLADYFSFILTFIMI